MRQSGRRQISSAIAGVAAGAALVLCSTVGTAGGGAQAGSGARAAGAATTAPAQAPQPPQITLAPGLRPVPDYRKVSAEPPPPVVPEGFTSIFNGRDLSGWHVSKTARHGVTPDFHVAHGMILGTQRPLGGGGLLLTDRRYGNFELHMEVKPDWGNDSGIFFRTSEEGVAYQITMDYLPGGSMGRLIGEGGIQGTVETSPVTAAASPASTRSGAPARQGGPAGPGGAAAQGGGGTPGARGVSGRGESTDPGMTAWNHEDWNTVRVRVQGEAPRATVWINGQQVSDARDSANHALDAMIDGPIAIQIHGGTARWQPGGFWRWRNIAIRELPNE